MKITQDMLVLAMGLTTMIMSLNLIVNQTIKSWRREAMLKLLKKYKNDFKHYALRNGINGAKGVLTDSAVFYMVVKDFLVINGEYQKSVFKYLDDEIYKSERRAKYIRCDCGGLSKSPGDFVSVSRIFYCVEKNVK